VIGDVVRKAEEAFCGEVSLGDEEDIDVMGKKKDLKFIILVPHQVSHLSTERLYRVSLEDIVILSLH
jgi:hypothetical protein